MAGQDKDHYMNRNTAAGLGQSALIEAINRVQEECVSRIIHNGPMHGRDQCRVWQVTGVSLRAGQDRSKFWRAIIQANLGSGREV